MPVFFEELHSNLVKILGNSALFKHREACSKILYSTTNIIFYTTKSFSGHSAPFMNQEILQLRLSDVTMLYEINRG